MLSVGDIIDFTMHEMYRVRGVIIKVDDEDDLPLARVMGTVPVAVAEVYEKQRGWYIFEDYKAQLITDPSDEDCAMAMRILLTDFCPGVDDASA